MRIFQELNQFPWGRIKNLNGVFHHLEYVPQRAKVLFLVEVRIYSEEISEHKEFALKVFAVRCFMAIVFLF